MSRVLVPELLDTLPPGDASAIKSRRDLQRINWWMGNASLLAESFKQLTPAASQRIFEIGAGDGTLLLALAQKIKNNFGNIHATFLDQQSLLSPETASAFNCLGWKVEVQQCDVLNFDFQNASGSVVLANLFLHHFEDAALRNILAGIARHAAAFIAIEPRRQSRPEAVLPLLRLIGCNSVTRHDAVASIRAGFFGKEISALWPNNISWQLTESTAGLFSHRFIAIRRNTNA